MSPVAAGERVEWLRALKGAGAARFAELGYPTQAQEQWRHTSVEAVAKGGFEAAAEPGVAPSLPERVCPEDWPRLVFIDGFFAPKLSNPPADLLAASLSALLESAPEKLEPYLGRAIGPRPEAFAALNTASFADGAAVIVPPSAAPQRPLHLLFIASAAGKARRTHPRVLVALGRQARLELVEEYCGGAGEAFVNPAVEVILAEGARLEHTTIQREGVRTLHVGTTSVRLARDASYVSNVVTLGGALVRNDLGVVLDGEGAECALNGLYLAGGRAHVDNHTTVEHARPHGTSRELYKGVLAGQARAVFNGSVNVRPDAQKTSAVQTNKNLVLSEEAVVHTKPELEIRANDVQCKHGATIGQISADALFYLRSRGIDAGEARRLLVSAFIAELTGLVSRPELREALDLAAARTLSEIE